MEKICKTCGKKFVARKERIYCSLDCYFDDYKGKPKPIGFGEKISKALKGRPKPYMRGSKNPNYGNVLQSKPEARKKFLIEVKKRGQPWTKKHREEHSKRMLGPTNKMRGRHHTKETREKISRIKKEQYASGSVKIREYKRSKAELEIEKFLISKGIKFKAQYHIRGNPYTYDFYFPDHNLLLEYQGDYWHANPKKYSSNEYINIQGSGPTLVKDIWNRDEHKKRLAENRGYIVLYIWENNYRKYGIDCIKEVLLLYFF